MIRSVGFILITVVGAILILFLLVSTSDKTQKPGGFTRIFKDHYISKSDVYKSQFRLNAIAGSTKSNIYLSTENPDFIEYINMPSEKLFTLNIADPFNIHTGPLFWIFIDSPLIRLMTGNGRHLLLGNLNMGFTKKDSILCYNFNWIISVSQNSYFVRAADSGFKDQSIVKYDAISRKIISIDHEIEKKGDGGISTDGTITYDEATQLYIYTQFYRNQIYCFDSNLTKHFIFHSIDTCYHFQTEALHQPDAVGNISFTVKGVPNYVSLASDASYGKLYLHSRQMSNNESKYDYMNNSVIDVYDLKSRSYDFSFYIPDFKNEHMTTFKVFKDFMIVLYPKDAILFNFY